MESRVPRPRAQSQSDSVHSRSKRIIVPGQADGPSKAQEELDDSPESSPSHVIKVLSTPQTPIKSKPISIMPDAEEPEAKASEEEFTELSSSQKESKFKLFAAAFKKSSPRGASAAASSTSSKNSSPRSANSSPRSGSPRLFKTSGGSKSHTPTLSDSSESSSFGEMPINQSEASFLFQAAKKRMEDAKNDKRAGTIYSYRSTSKGYAKEFDIVISGSEVSLSKAEDHSVGASFYMLDRSAKLGEGASAKVFVAYKLQTGEKLAAKVYKDEEAYNISLLRAEINCLIKLKRFHGGLNLLKESKGEKIIFNDYLPGLPLLKVLYLIVSDEQNEIEFIGRRQYPMQSRLNLVLGAMEGIAQLHELGFIHRDIKTDNFLGEIKPNVIVNLTDFDTAILNTEKIDRIASSFGYLAPEQAKDKPDYYTVASDLFSTGIVIWEILSNVNFQDKLISKCAEIKEKSGGWFRHLKREEILEMMTDFHGDSVDFSYDPTHTMDEYVYNAKIKAHLYSLVALLIQEDPLARLRGSSLREEIKKVSALTEIHAKLTDALPGLLSGMDAIQAMGLSLDILKPLTENILLLQEKDLLSAMTALLSQPPQTSLDPEKCIEDGLKRITDLLKAIKLFVKSYVELQPIKDQLSHTFIQPLLAVLTRNPKEALGFLESVSLLSSSPAPSCSKKHF